MIKQLVKRFLDVAVIPTVRYVYDRRSSDIPRTKKYFIPDSYYNEYPIEFSPEERRYMWKLFNYVRFMPLEAYNHRYDCDDSLSMVPREGIFAALLAVKYILDNNIDGDIVECGVWRGGYPY